MRTRWPGVGPRIIQRLKVLGYTSTRSKTGVDLMRFSLERSYPITYLQKWATDGATPDRENILRLSADLGVSLQWLLVGGEEAKPKVLKAKRRLHPIAGGSATLAPDGQAQAGDQLPLIRHTFHTLWGWLAGPTLFDVWKSCAA